MSKKDKRPPAEIPAPEIEEADEVRDARKEAEMYSAVSAFNDSEGGRILRDYLSRELTDAVLDVANMATKYTHIEFIQRALFISERMDLLVKMGVASSKFELMRKTIQEMTEL